MVIHSDCTSAIARTLHSGAGPGQTTSESIQRIVNYLKLRISEGIRKAKETWPRGTYSSWHG